MFRQFVHASAKVLKSAKREAKSQASEIKPIATIPFAPIDRCAPNPIAAIIGSAAFGETTRFFADNPAAARSLMSPNSQALLYTIIRNTKPRHVVEIGTFMCGTTEAICRALHDNGVGTLHTVDPFGSDRAPRILGQWPESLCQHVKFYPIDSMAFYMQMENDRIRPDLAFVDGNHDYEFALFDIQCAARRLTPGGFIFVDNVSQPGPFFATRDFLAAHPGWKECGNSSVKERCGYPYDRHRTDIVGTDFIVLRAPDGFLVGGRPVTSGEQPWTSNPVGGLRLALKSSATAGTLHAQCILRGFGSTQVEVIGEAHGRLDGERGEIAIPFAIALVARGEYSRYTVEPWLVWEGDSALELFRSPTIF